MNEWESTNSGSESSSTPKWKPLSRLQRRVVGVLIEKAKTTPDAYPLTLNAITTGCNQKSNRHPRMEVESDDVLITLDELRDMGAVTEIQSSGRVAKYRHQMYDWLGVNKVELAVMGELLLRGEQSLGDLRARTARMESVPDIQTLRPICQSLMDKGLLVALTPEGRGQIVDHNLYQESKPRSKETTSLTGSPGTAGADAPATTSPAPNPDQSEKSQRPGSVAELAEQLGKLQSEVARLAERMSALEKRVS